MKAERGAARTAFRAARAAQLAARRVGSAPAQAILSFEEQFIEVSLVRGTRGYIESVAGQINGCYRSEWYDACAVMIRRLVEVLIIEAFEAHGAGESVKDEKDHFLHLGELIGKACSESSWNLGRNAKQALPKLKDIGDLSAHGRRFIARRSDIDRVASSVRVVVEELVYLAKLRK